VMAHSRGYPLFGLLLSATESGNTFGPLAA
jgi:hypothetical protein